MKISKTTAMSLNKANQDIVNIVVRICGVLLLFVGLWLSIQVFSEALSLYKNPGNILRMATAIEAGSNIDKSFRPTHDSLLGQNEISVKHKSSLKIKTDNFRISYFIAWVIDLLLLLLLARISITAIKTGGELALYDAQIKRLARQIVQAKRKQK